MLKQTFLFFCFAFFLSESYSQVSIKPEPSWKLPVKKTDFKPKMKDISGGFYERLYEIQHHIESQTSYTHIIREIVSASGVQNGSEISVNYEPSFQKLVFHKIAVWRDGKEINKLRPGVVKIEPVETEKSDFIYNGTNAASVILDDIRKGDRVEYSYSITGSNPVFNGKFFNNLYFYTTTPVSQFYFTKIVSPSRKLYLREKNGPTKPKVSQKNGLKYYEWDIVAPKIYKFEDYEPSWFEGYPFVQFSEYNSWKEVVDWALPLYPLSNQPSAVLKAKIEELKRKSNGDIVVYADLAMKFAQEEIRYTGIEIGENSHKPHDPGVIMKQRFGDCKDKSFLLCNLLKGGGIEAYPALVNTYSRNNLVNVQPSPIAFNHVIVCANLDGNQTWLDPTITHRKGKIINGYVPYYGKALLIKPNESQLTTIPENYPGSVKVTERYVVPEIGEPAKLEVISRYSIASANKIRAQIAETSQAELEETYLNYYKGLYASPIYVSMDTMFYHDEEINSVFTVTERYTIEDLWQKQDSSSSSNVINFLPPFFSDQLRKLKEKKRISPIGIDYPYDLDYNLEIVFPEQWSVTDKPFSIKRDSYEFESSSFYDKKNKTWFVRFQYKTLRDFVPAEDYAQYNSDVKKIDEELGKSITWNGESNEDSSISSGFSGARNPFMIITGLMALLVFTFAAYKYYRYSLPVTTNQMPLKISGILTIAGIFITLAPVLLLTSLVTTLGNYTSLQIWNTNGSGFSVFKFILAFEYIGIIALIVGSFVLILLYYGKRNTLRQGIIIYNLFSIFYILVLFLMTNYYKEFFSSESYTALDLIKTFVKASVWIACFYFSPQIKKTFILPYGIKEKEFEGYLKREKDQN